MKYIDNLLHNQANGQGKRAQATTMAKPEQRGEARSALGNATKLRTPPLKTTSSKNYSVVDYSTGEIESVGVLPQIQAINLARKVRYELQDTARNILYGFHGSKVPVNAKGYEVHHRTCTCTRFRSGVTTQIVKSKTNGKAFYTGLMNCANSRTCPVCSAKISERKANEMRMAFNIARAEKLCISMLTLTAPHNSGDRIEDLKVKISDALQRIWRGSPAKKFKDRFGIIGNIRSFEVRHGDNGWHPHFHIIIFSKKPLPLTLRSPSGHLLKNQSDEWNNLLSRWKKACLSSGLDCPNDYGMDIQNGAFAGEYISKFGSDDEFLTTSTGKKVTWDMADEMTKGNTKTGRKGSKSPWDLLSDSVEAKTKEERTNNKLLFLFYARAMQGVNLIRWSKGLRNYFDLDADISDEEILKQEMDKADFLCHISPSEWEYVIKNNKRHILLELAENGGSEAVARLFYPSYSYMSFEEFHEEFLARKELVDLDIPDVNDYESTETRHEIVHNVKPQYQDYLSTSKQPPAIPFNWVGAKRKEEKRAKSAELNRHYIELRKKNNL
jgi:hypothetical protein